MKIKSLILFIIFSLFLISCESKDKWINPYDSKADQAEVDKICKQNNKECGIFSVNYKGVSFEMDCGECSDGYECRFSRNKNSKRVFRRQKLFHQADQRWSVLL